MFSAAEIERRDIFLGDSRDHSWEAVWPALIFCLISDATQQLDPVKTSTGWFRSPVFSLCRVSRGVEVVSTRISTDPPPIHWEPGDYLLTVQPARPHGFPEFAQPALNRPRSPSPSFSSEALCKIVRNRATRVLYADDE